MATIQIKSQVTLVEDSGVQVVLPETVTQNEFIKGALSETIIIENPVSNTMVTPVTVSLESYPNTTCIVLKAEYAENDFPNGIKAGDRAKFQFRFDGGNWCEAYSVILEGYKPATPEIEIRAQGAAKILVRRTVSATE
ncbi:hypothetical protein [Leptospira levettii]|uniref:DUF1573 domain-containing protein n=1 Tax=Leptospira levettii TaxID=2023178 RepID=A0ABY2MTU6_9LEPT|nr:hypothetical protein [Leptospira levettii]TGL75374.1 hypothetical protein EHQ60_00165 [Leptospira levettii]